MKQQTQDSLSSRLLRVPSRAWRLRGGSSRHKDWQTLSPRGEFHWRSFPRIANDYANCPMRNLFDDPKPMILPSILSADFSRLAEDCRDVLDAGADALHVDVMDGHFVPNITFAAPVFKWLRKAFPSIFIDVHLMIDQPVRYAPDMVKAGANNLTFHVEAPEVKSDLIGAAREIRKLGCHVGITLKPGTPIDAVLPALDEVDLILIMSVEPGFGGQSFMADQLQKVRTLRPLLKPHQRIEIDGGIDESTIGQAYQAGVDWFVAGSAIFTTNDRRHTISTMRQAILAHPRTS